MTLRLAFLIMASAVSLTGQNEPGRLIVRLPHPDAKIFLNDSLVVFQEEGTEVRPGRMVVRVPHPNRVSSRFPDFMQAVEVGPGQVVTVDVLFNSLHRLETVPSGTDVYDGDRYMGTTPLVMDLTNRVSTRLRFEKVGFETKTVRVTTPGQDTAVITVALIPASPNVRINENVFASGAWAEEGVIKNKPAILTVSLVGLGAGALAAYYKSRADNAFENAKLARRAGDQVAKQRFLNKASKYDQYAAISYVGMQVNVVTLFYLLFKSN